MKDRTQESNRALKNRLLKAIRRGEVHHGYLVEAPKTVDKIAFVKWFITNMVCTEGGEEACGRCDQCQSIRHDRHLDLTHIRATVEKNAKVASVKDEEIHRLQERLAMAPAQGERNYAIIEDADLLTVKAMNRFLKTLEEPLPGTVIFLLSTNRWGLPATIQSRCVPLVLEKEENQKPKKNWGRSLFKSLMAKQPYYQLNGIIKNMPKEREALLLMLDQLEEALEEKLTDSFQDPGRERIFAWIEEVEKTRKVLLGNGNMTYAIKHMTLTMRRES